LRKAALLLLCFALAGCGGGAAEPEPPTDRRLEQANQAGTRALTLNQTAEAIRQYRLALARAYERDDPTAIGDVGYNLAVAQLRAGATQDAARTARETRAELERRKLSPPADLLLVQSAIAYRVGAQDEALAAVQEVLRRSPLDPETATRAWYIRGAVMADRGDTAGLAQAITAIPASAQPDQEADRFELLGRASMIAGANGEAVENLERAADQRRIALDYRGMARALALAGDAALKLGRTNDAAVYFLRGGRSALLQGDAATGRRLLDRAGDLARQTGDRGITGEIERVRRETTPPKA
jgi:tetratricopeptide (TPR) repeat protein